MNQFKNRILATLTLFSSVSTLLCCALPALLVSLGAGAVMAGLVSTVPQLIIISRHKPTVFIIAGLLLVLSGFIQWRNRPLPTRCRPRLSLSTLAKKQSDYFLYLACGLYYGCVLCFHRTSDILSHLTPQFLGLYIYAAWHRCCSFSRVC